MPSAAAIPGSASWETVKSVFMGGPKEAGMGGGRRGKAGTGEWRGAMGKYHRKNVPHYIKNIVLPISIQNEHTKRPFERIIYYFKN